MEDAFGLVDPKEVRWASDSHEDADHVGNLEEVMRACPNATLVCSWALTERHTNAFEFPLGRCQWMDDGVTSTRATVRCPWSARPSTTSPTTRGLLDSRRRSTGGRGRRHPCREARAPPTLRRSGELDQEFWGHGMTMFAHNALAPWLRLVDEERFGNEVQRISDQGSPRPPRPTARRSQEPKSERLLQ